MKKILLVLLLSFGALFLASCDRAEPSVWTVEIVENSIERTPLESLEFGRMLDEMGYFVTNSTHEFPTEEVGIVLVAVGGNFNLEFWGLTSEEAAIGLINVTRAELEEIYEEHSGHEIVEVIGANYEIITHDNGERFLIISRIEDTIVYINMDPNVVDKDMIIGIITEIGYM
ncbi:MAG: hypothetical protein FWD82_02575 [Defluviitaleaceae bacterium]|nr:hypothetical protein [Defluviitaleaceae bacterium]